MNFLIKLARMVVEQVLSQLMQLFQAVIEQAMEPVRQIVSQVTGGDWIGDGADAFVNELNSLCIPNIGKVSDSITTANKNLTFARDTMDNADQQLASMVQSRLSDTFKFY